jgi:hypothetical protein
MMSHWRFWFGLVLVIVLRPQTPKHILGGWSHYTETSEPADGNGAQSMVTVQSGFEPAIFRSLAHELTNCSNRAHSALKGSLLLGNTWHRIEKKFACGKSMMMSHWREVCCWEINWRLHDIVLKGSLLVGKVHVWWCRIEGNFVGGKCII